MATQTPLPTSKLKVSWFISALATALFTGLMACFIIAIDPTLSELDGVMYTTVMQKLIHHADIPPLVPMMVIVSLVAPLFTLFFLRKHLRHPGFRWTLIGFVFAVIVLFITVVLNVPINEYIKTWKLEQIPTDWEAKRAAWHQLNIFRTPASAFAFASHLIAGFYLWKTDNGYSEKGMLQKE